MHDESRFDLAGKVALVTGAAGGIGQSLVLGLARAGADVVILDRESSASLEQLENQVRSVGRRCWTLVHDLADTDNVQVAADRAHEMSGGVDILVNNAGIATIGRFNEISAAVWRRVMAVNLDAPFLLAQRCAEYMISAGLAGRIINITSNSAHVAEIGLVHYNSAKAGLAMVTQSMALELGEFGITVNSIAPGVIDTGIVDHYLSDPAAFREYYRTHIPLQGRYGTPEDCVGALLLLASQAGSYITGQHIVVDGGVLSQKLPRGQFLAPYRPTVTSGEGVR